ncbi:Actin-related protein 2/3 complex subunit 3 [Rhodotorula toruloides]|nr:Actin-related protein 2/3 complex subunit 3 [Rhodotorula toruloides]
MPAYNASAADLDGARLVGNFPLLPFRSSIRGPAAQPADPSIPDIIDESLQLFRANSLFRNFEIKTPADRALIYLILFIGDCLGRIAQARTWTHQDALKQLTTHSLSHFSLPGEPGFPLNQVFIPPSPPTPVEKDALRSWLVQARQETVVRLLERHVYNAADESTEGGKRPSKWWMAFSTFPCFHVCNDSPTPSVHPIAILSARTPSTTTPASNGLTTMLFTFLLLLSTTLAFAIPPDPPAQHAFLPSSSLSPPPPLSLSNSTRLPLTLGVMSLCPDARLCESVMDRVFEQTTSIAVRGAGEGGGKKEGKVRVGELVELRVEFIASRNSSAPYGTTCKHGDRECRGNVQQLCAERYWGAEGAWEFIQCLNYDPNARVGNERAARECGRLIGRDWTKQSQQCVEGEEGRKLARQSAKRLSELGVEKSCSILVRGEVVCIHDSTWQHCPSGHEVGDFKRLIEREWERENGRGR